MRKIYRTIYGPHPDRSLNFLDFPGSGLQYETDLASDTPMISNILVLGGGSAGFVAAITLKRKQPHLDIRVIRSPEIGIIGVGEGTTPNFGRHFFECLGLPPKDFFEIARPTWKAGIRFL